MRDERLIEGVLQSLSFFRGASLGQLAIVAKQCWTLEASRGDTIARHALRPAARADRWCNFLNLPHETPIFGG